MRAVVIWGVLLSTSGLALGQGRPALSPDAPDIRQREAEPMVMPDRPPRQSDWVDEALEQAQQAGSQVVPAEDLKQDPLSPYTPEIRQYIGRLTTAMLSEDSWQGALEMLCDADIVRLKKQMEEVDPEAHKQLLKQFAEQWRARYAAEFDLGVQHAVMAEYVVLRGQRTPDEAIVVSEQIQDGREIAPVRPEQDHHATVVVPGSARYQQPGMILQMQNEQPGVSQWRMNTPDTLSARRLQQNIQERLGRLIEGVESWPTDPKEAYRLVSYHVLASLNDQPLERPRESQPAAPRPPLEPDNPSLES